jgi:hypothetical protein
MDKAIPNTLNLNKAKAEMDKATEPRCSCMDKYKLKFSLYCVYPNGHIGYLCSISADKTVKYAREIEDKHRVKLTLVFGMPTGEVANYHNISADEVAQIVQDATEDFGYCTT